MVDALYSSNNHYLDKALELIDLGKNTYWSVTALDKDSNKLKLYDSPSETSSYKIVDSDTYYSYYLVLEIGKEVYPSVCKPYNTKPNGDVDFFKMYRWIKIYDEKTKNYGWLKPGDSLWTYCTTYAEISE